MEGAPPPIAHAPSARYWTDLVRQGHVGETEEQVPYPVPTEAALLGTLPGGALFSIKFEGGQPHPTGVQIVITGITGALRIAKVRGFENRHDNTIEALTGDDEIWTELPIPAEYETVAGNHLDVSAKDVAYLYQAYANDRRDGTSTAANLRHAVWMHRLLDQVLTPKTSTASDLRHTAAPCPDSRPSMARSAPSRFGDTVALDEATFDTP